MSASDRRPPGPLHGRRALVTGASRGIGAAVAARLAELGADLVLTARSESSLDAVAAGLRELRRDVCVVPADLSDRLSLARLMDRVAADPRGLQILVNNAGLLPTAVRAEKVTWEDWDRTLEVNLSAAWFLSCRARELMEEGGVVVNVASTAALYPSRGLVAYNVSKAAMLMLTRVLALEWASAGIRVVGVAPGKVDTDLVAPILAWSQAHDRALNPTGRIGRPSEIADLVGFLVDDRAAYLTGVTVPIDGGELLAP